jgi:hypothetical protein
VQRLLVRRGLEPGDDATAAADGVVPAPRGVIRADLTGPRPIDGGGVSGLESAHPGRFARPATTLLMCAVPSAGI